MNYRETINATEKSAFTFEDAMAFVSNEELVAA